MMLPLILSAVLAARSYLPSFDGLRVVESSCNDSELRELQNCLKLRKRSAGRQCKVKVSQTCYAFTQDTLTDYKDIAMGSGIERDASWFDKEAIKRLESIHYSIPAVWVSTSARIKPIFLQARAGTPSRSYFQSRAPIRYLHFPNDWFELCSGSGHVWWKPRVDRGQCSVPQYKSDSWFPALCCP